MKVPVYSNGTLFCGAEPPGWYYERGDDPPFLIGPFKTKEEAVEDQEPLEGGD